MTKQPEFDASAHELTTARPGRTRRRLAVFVTVLLASVVGGVGVGVRPAAAGCTSVTSTQYIHVFGTIAARHRIITYFCTSPKTATINYHEAVSVGSWGAGMTVADLGTQGNPSIAMYAQAKATVSIPLVGSINGTWQHVFTAYPTAMFPPYVSNPAWCSGC